LRWSCVNTGEETASVAFEARLDDEAGYVTRCGFKSFLDQMR
jgi:hypothetical protein